ncbi:MAG: hypothetical protein ACKOC4_04680, partial [Planctomycetia bacterium]
MRSCLFLAAAILAAMPARGATPGIASGAPRPQPGLTAALSAWREIPVLEDGRILPLDTFARRMADTICHAQTPKLATGVDGKLARWQADELLLDWLVRPAAWEDVPFLTAEHEEVRKLLDLPLFAETATVLELLKHAAPSDVEDCEPLRERLMAIDERRREAMRDGVQFQLEGADAKVEQVWRAFVAWRRLTFRAATADMGRSRFVRLFERMAGDWRNLRPRLGTTPEAGPAVAAVDATLTALADALGESTRFATGDAEARVPAVRAAVERLAALPGLPPADRRGVGRLEDRIGLLAESLYDDGGGLLVVPALHAEPLEAERSADDDAPPWLALATLLDAPPEVLAGYPPAAVADVRSAFSALAAAVEGRRDADAAAAAGRLAAALRAVGVAVEPLRAQLPAERIDAD